MEDLLKLLEAAPPHLQDKARKSLAAVLEEYEDWLSLGKPTEEEHQLIKYARTQFKHPMKFQEVVKKILREKRDEWRF